MVGISLKWADQPFQKLPPVDHESAARLERRALRFSADATVFLRGYRTAYEPDGSRTRELRKAEDLHYVPILNAVAGMVLLHKAPSRHCMSLGS